MTAAQTATVLLTLAAGVGVFLIACGMLGESMQTLGGKKLKALFSCAEKSKLLGLGVGALTTAAIQSSGATTVTVIGFVGAGVMSLSQAATVIFGANIGTTITGQLVALGLFGSETVSVSVALGALAGVGALVKAFSRSAAAKSVGTAVAAFGLIFVGLSMMGGAMKAVSVVAGVTDIISAIDAPTVLVLTGAVFTAVMQSSSVMSSVAIAMTASGLITLNQGIYLMIGANIGTCTTVFLVGLSGGEIAKRCAYIQLVFNVVGAAMFMAAGVVMRVFGTDFGLLFSSVRGAPQLQLAVFHTAFNVVTAAVLLPFTDRVVKLSCRLAVFKK